MSDGMRRRYKPGRRGGMTIIELLLAVLLLGVIIMTALSMELGLRRIFVSTDTEAQLLAEATPILSMITKDINRGIGNFVNSSYNNAAWSGDTAFRIRLDSNNNALTDAGDIWVGYRFRGTAGINRNELWRYPDASGVGYVVISNKVTAFSILAPSDGVSNISIQIRKDPTQAVSATNPEITVNASAQFRGYALQ